MRDYLKEGYEVRAAASTVITECLQNGILVDVLTRCRTEVLEVLLTEYNEAETMEYLRKEAQEIGWKEGHAAGHEAGWAEGLSEGRAEGLSEGWAEGLSEGRAEAMEQGIKNFVELCQELGMSRESAMCQLDKKYGLDETEMQRYMEMYWI